MKKVVSLYRYQGAESNLTIELQQESCQNYAKQKGWKIEKEYVAEENVSGTFQDPLVQIKKSVESGEVDAVLVYSYFCISGNYMEAPMVLKWLLCNGVELWGSMEDVFLQDN